MARKPLHPFKKTGPLFETALFREVKDPCIVHDGKLWRIYGSGISKDGSGIRVARASAPEISGPWSEDEPARLDGPATIHAGAPGVIFDEKDGLYHMAIQEDFTSVGGKIEYFASEDGLSFAHVSTVLSPIPDSGEAGLYDPHLCILEGDKYLVYAGMSAYIPHGRPFIPQPDIFLAKSVTGLWAGPYERLGKMLDHAEVLWHHNRLDHPDYEWGIEGPQIVELPDGRMLLNATCFLEEGSRGTRQRVFFAIADDILGPYRSIGPVLTERDNDWESGENGHATAWIAGDSLHLFYQARGFYTAEPGKARWRYGLASFRIEEL